MIFIPGTRVLCVPICLYLKNALYLPHINKTLDTMTPEQREAIRANLFNKSVNELVETILDCYDELEEAKRIRRRFKQIQNLLLDPEERKKPGRPKKEKQDI